MKFFIQFYNVKVTEFDLDLNKYSNFQNFFTRKFFYSKYINNNILFSPCSGIVKEYGKLRNENFENNKEKYYSISEFIGMKPILLNSRSNLFYISIHIPIGYYHYSNIPSNIIFNNKYHFTENVKYFKKSNHHYLKTFPFVNNRIILNGYYKLNHVKNKTKKGFLSFIIMKEFENFNKKINFFEYIQDILPIKYVVGKINLSKNDFIIKNYIWSCKNSLDITK